MFRICIRLIVVIVVIVRIIIFAIIIRIILIITDRCETLLLFDVAANSASEVLGGGSLSLLEKVTPQLQNFLCSEGGE